MKVEEIITNRIVKLLEAGTVPWHKPWANRQTGADAFPRNAITKRHYRGINVFILASQSYGSPCWLTYKEALMLGEHVKAGENGTPIVFWKWLSREIEKADGSIRALKGDAKLVIVAAAAAQKATDYILNRQAETAQETACALAA